LPQVRRNQAVYFGPVPINILQIWRINTCIFGEVAANFISLCRKFASSGEWLRTRILAFGEQNCLPLVYHICRKVAADILVC
jgi:hypothetical protein